MFSRDGAMIFQICNIHPDATYLCSLQVAALPLPGRTVLRHGDLDLLKLGLGVVQLHLQVLCQLGSLHRLQGKEPDAVNKILKKMF